IGTFGISRDITERKQQEEQLLKLSQALEQTADAVYITDRRGVIEYVNAAFTQMTGLGRGEALGQSPRLIRLEQSAGALDRELEAILRQGRTQRQVRDYRHRDGRVFWADETITPLRDPDGGITHFVTTFKDITDIRRAMEELRKSRERFAL